jgi:adenosylhomocysteine nucleosidase
VAGGEREEKREDRAAAQARAARLWEPGIFEDVHVVTPAEILVVFALRAEAADAFEGVASPLLFTGVGKVNSAWALTRSLMLHRPRLVLDFGTVGSPRFAPHTLVECTHFIQRDMDARPLGLPLGATPFDELPAVLEVPRRLAGLPAVTCGSADHFVSGHDVGAADVVEMEAYALARVCRLEGVEFMAIKYVTDGGDAGAHSDWQSNLPRAAAAFRAVYDRIVADGRA